MSTPLNDRLTGPYVATGGETVLVYDFPVLSGADLEVRRRRDGAETLLALTTDYIVDGVGSLSGGNVVLADAAEAGDEYVVEGARPAARISDLVAEQGFKAAALNAELDSLQMQVAELRRRMDMAVQRSRFDIETVSLELPPWDGEGPRAVVINADGAADLVNYETIGEGPATWGIPVDWETGLVCTVGPPSTVVSYDAGSGAELYVCVTSHTAGATFSGDAGKWRRIAGEPPPAFDIDALTTAGTVDRAADLLVISQAGTEKKIAPGALIPEARTPLGWPMVGVFAADTLPIDFWGGNLGVSASSAGNFNQHRLQLVPFHPGRARTLSKLALRVTTAAAGKSARLGIYKCAASGRPGELLLDAGTLSLASTGLPEIAIDQTVGDALHWLAVVADGVAGMMLATAANYALGLIPTALGVFDEAKGVHYTYIYAALPADITAEDEYTYTYSATGNPPVVLWQ